MAGLLRWWVGRPSLTVGPQTTGRMGAAISRSGGGGKGWRGHTRRCGPLGELGGSGVGAGRGQWQQRAKTPGARLRLGCENRWVTREELFRMTELTTCGG